MPSTAGVGPQAQQIQGVFANTVSIQNVGPGDVYLGSDSSVRPDNGWLLPARGMGTWEGGAQLWACTDGGTTQLRIADSALTFFTPGPDHVTVDGGTVTIDNASIPITGTVDIASGTVNASISGPVTVNGGTVTVGGTVTAQNDAKTLVSNNTIYNVPTGTPLSIFDSTGTSLVGYSTLQFTFGGGNVSGVDPSVPVRVVVSQYTSTGILVKAETPEMFASGFIRYTTQIVAPVVKITAVALLTGAPVRALAVTVLSAALPHSYYQNPGSTSRFVNITSGQENGYTLAKYISMTGNVAASSTGVYYPETISGPANLTWWTSSNSGVDYQIANYSGIELRRSSPLTLTNGTGNVRLENGPFYFPETPVNFQMTNRSTTATVAMMVDCVLG